MMNHTSEQQSQDSPMILNDEDRIKILDGVLAGLNVPKILPISISSEPIKRQTKPGAQQPQIQYRIYGSKYNHRSKNSYLVQRLQELDRAQEQQQALADEKDKFMEDDSAERSVQQADEQMASFKGEEQFRYFKDNMICFKCNKVGHYKLVCPQAKTCLYCFSPAHEAQKCPQKNVCFKCYGFGHIFANCKAKDNNPRCFVCEKNHEGGCNFLQTKIKDSYKRNDFYNRIYNDKDIRCLKCFNYGHLQCHF